MDCTAVLYSTFPVRQLVTIVGKEHADFLATLAAIATLSSFDKAPRIPVQTFVALLEH